MAASRWTSIQVNVFNFKFVWIAAFTLLLSVPLRSHGDTGSFSFLPVSLTAASVDGAVNPGMTSIPPTAGQQIEEKPTIENFVVKVHNKEASPFSGVMTSQSHGTAFVVDVNEDEGTITLFTNRHVIETHSAFMAQSLQIAVSNSQVPEMADAELIYKSNLYDFAVLKVKMADLPRTGKNLRALPLPPPDHPFFHFPQNMGVLNGRTALAAGNPYDSEQIVTEGRITGIHNSLVDGPSIQTQVPINPGNSGGPLIDAQTGIVLGINTAIIYGAQNVGYTIPIGRVIQDYTQFQQDKKFGISKTPPVTFDVAGLDEVAALGQLSTLLARYPGLDARTKGVIRITDAKPSYLKEDLPDGSAKKGDLDPSAFMTGDLILSINGQLVGTQYFEYRRAVQSSETVEIEVLRNDKILKLTQTYHVDRFKRLREKADFVIASGLLFYQDRPSAVWNATGTGGTNSVVRIAGPILSDSELAFSAAKIPAAESLVVGVSLNGKHYPVETLFDLKLALRENPNAKTMRLDVRMAMWGNNQENQPSPMRYPNGQIMVLPNTSIHTLPVTEVWTPADFSLRGFIQQFSFRPQDRESRNFREWMEKGKTRANSQKAKSSATCEANLKSAAAAASVGQGPDQGALEAFQTPRPRP